MVPCPACGLELPPYARFCARCGASIPGARRSAGPATATWVLVLFFAGAALAAVFALFYGAVLVSPDLAGAQPGLDARELRSAIVIVVLCAASLFVAQLAASIGLLRGRPWGRFLATLVCVAWALTCVGLPLSVLALNSIWRGPVNSVGDPLPR